MNFVRSCAVLISAVLFSGCSEMLPRNGILESLPKGSLVVLDQMNQSVKAFDLSSNRNIMIGTLPTTTLNDLKIQGDFAYVVLSSPIGNPSEGNKLVRYNLRTGFRSYLSFATGSSPNNQVIDGTRIYVTLLVSNQVAVVDIDSFSVIGLISLTPAGAPYGIAVDDNNIYVATSIGFIGWGDPGNYSNSRITVIAKTNLVQVTNIPCGKNPLSLSVNSGKLYIAEVSDYDDTGKVEVMDLTTLTLTVLAGVPACSPYVVRSTGNNLFILDGTFIGNDGLYVYSLSNSSVTNILPGVTLQGLDISGGFLYLSEAFGGTMSYRVNLTNLAVETIGGIGGGDCAFYQ